MQKPLRLARNLARNRRGSAMVEFAIGSAVLVAVFTGTFRFGYTFLQYNNLENAVARGARYAALKSYDSATNTPSDAFSLAVKNVVLYGSPTAGTSPVLPGLTTANVNLNVVSDSSGNPLTMTVSISGYTIDSIFGTITLTNKPQVTCPYLGIWSPV